MSEEGGGGGQIFIKRVKKVQGGAHGGAWKIAYADFVTAMMAFFLLLWLLNSVTQEQLEGISNYFAPASVAPTTSGAGGVLGGQTLAAEGSEVSARAKPTVSLALPPPKTGLGGDDLEQGRDSEEEKKQEEKEASEEAIKKAEDNQFKEVQQQIQEALKDIPDADKLSKSLVVDNTPEGLRIQIVDQEGFPMFPSGGSEPLERTLVLLDLVKSTVEKLSHKLAIAGHTDAVPFGLGSDLTNWELSANRANAARRYFIEQDLPAERISRIVGKADTEPLLSEDPRNARNRRIAITVLRGTGAPTKTIAPGEAIPSVTAPNRPAPDLTGPAPLEPASPPAAADPGQPSPADPPATPEAPTEAPAALSPEPARTPAAPVTSPTPPTPTAPPATGDIIPPAPGQIIPPVAPGQIIPPATGQLIPPTPQPQTPASTSQIIAPSSGRVIPAAAR